MRKRIFQIIEIAEDNDILSRIYDIFMMLVIVASLAPLVTKQTNSILTYLDLITVCIFSIDYIARWITADHLLKKGKLSFIQYPFTILAIIDLLSMLPSISILGKGFKVLKMFRLLRTLRVLRVFKVVRYSRNIHILTSVIKRQKNALALVGVLALGYILTCALIMFNAEPNTFDTFFDAIYWATVSLTTVGYGDIYAVSNFGKIITMVSSLFGIAIVALPAGIITAGYMEVIESEKEANSHHK